MFEVSLNGHEPVQMRKMLRIQTDNLIEGILLPYIDCFNRSILTSMESINKN